MAHRRNKQETETAKHSTAQSDTYMYLLTHTEEYTQRMPCAPLTHDTKSTRVCAVLKVSTYSTSVYATQRIAFMLQ